MLITHKTWNMIRDKFTEDEKVLMRNAVTGEVICPADVEIDLKYLPDSLREKIISEVYPGGIRRDI